MAGLVIAVLMLSAQEGAIHMPCPSPGVIPYAAFTTSMAGVGEVNRTRHGIDNLHILF